MQSSAVPTTDTLFPVTAAWTCPVGPDEPDDSTSMPYALSIWLTVLFATLTSMNPAPVALEPELKTRIPNWFPPVPVPVTVLFLTTPVIPIVADALPPPLKMLIGVLMVPETELPVTLNVTEDVLALE